jgi:hypothetical protein
MGRFAKFLGDTQIEIDGEKLNLKATVRDMQKIMDMKDSKEKLVGLHDTLLEMMKHSYPEQPEDEIDAFVSKNIMKFVPELAIAWKWTTRAEFDRNLEEAKKSISPVS